MSADVSKPSTVAEALQVVHVDPAFMIGTFGRHLIVVWRRDVNVHGLTMASRTLTELQKKVGGKRINVLIYIEPEGTIPESPATFGASVDVLKRFEGTIAAFAIVYSREGFWNATMRGKVTAIHSESKTDMAYAIHPTLSAAVEWLAEHGAHDIEVTAQTVMHAVETLRKVEAR